jgi:hypothetical protein
LEHGTQERYGEGELQGCGFFLKNMFFIGHVFFTWNLQWLETEQFVPLSRLGELCGLDFEIWQAQRAQQHPLFQA